MRPIRRIHPTEYASRAHPAEKQHAEHDVVEGRDAETVTLAQTSASETGDELADVDLCLGVGDCAGEVVKVVVDWDVRVVGAVVEGEGDYVLGWRWGGFFG